MQLFSCPEVKLMLATEIWTPAAWIRYRRKVNHIQAFASQYVMTRKA